MSDVSARMSGGVDVALGFGRRGEVEACFDWRVLRLCAHREPLTSLLVVCCRRIRNVEVVSGSCELCLCSDDW